MTFGPRFDKWASKILIPCQVFLHEKKVLVNEALLTCIHRNENVTQNRGAEGRLFLHTRNLNTTSKHILPLLGY